MYNPEVPFDNNLGERDLRMVKVKMKVSSHFKTSEWLNVYTTIKSYISTAQKQKVNLMDAIKNVHLDPISAASLGM